MATVTKRTWKTSKGEVRTAWRVDFVDAANNRHRKQFATKREAENHRIEIEGQVRGGTFRPDASKITVLATCDAFLEKYEARMVRGERVSRHHLSVVRGHVKNHILNTERGISAVKLSQMTARGINDFRDRLRDNGMTVVTCRKVLSTLHTILEFAKGQDYIATNVAHGIKVEGTRDEGAEKIVPPSKEALNAILAETDQQTHLILTVAALTGLRAGELWALKWGDIDFLGSIGVSRRVDTYGDVGPPKTKAGVRQIPIAGALVSLLKEWKLASNYSADEDLVFPNKVGKFAGHDNFVKRRFKPLFEKAGVEVCNFHALRHFAVSLWIEAQLPPKTIQTYAGHSSLQVTMDRYGHMFPQDSHVQVMDEIAGDILG